MEREREVVSSPLNHRNNITIYSDLTTRNRRNIHHLDFLVPEIIALSLVPYRFLSCSHFTYHQDHPSRGGYVPRARQKVKRER